MQTPGMTMNSSYWRVCKPIVAKGRVVEVRSFAWEPDPSLRERNNRRGKPGTALPEAPPPTPGLGNLLGTSACLPILCRVVLPTNSPLHHHDGKDSLPLSSYKETL
jgi:hypothetical protein